MNAIYQHSQTSGNNWTPDSYLVHGIHPQAQSEMPDAGIGLAVLEKLEKQMASFAKQQAEVIALRKFFVIDDGLSIEAFLGEHRTLPQLLLEATDYLRAAFGDDVVFKLRAPIDEYGSSTLYAVAMWSGPIADVRIALDRFDADWWLANSRRASGRLSITYELI